MVYLYFILLFYLAFYIIRVIKGPSIWDRLMALHLISSKVLLFFLLFASDQNSTSILDLAIISTLLGFISVVFIALFLLKRLKGSGK